MAEQNVQQVPDLKQRLASLYTYLATHLGIREIPKLTFTQNLENANNPWGLTGYYDHENKTIRIYITNRHETDILRSFAHEVIHHWQNERGTLHPQGGKADTVPHYAQLDPNLRKREMEAYLFGNILFRDWQDENRMGPPAVQPFMPQLINENLQLDPEKLKQYVANFVAALIQDGGLVAYHRDRTSGDMNPKDFTSDLVHDILSAVEKWVQTVNNRGNWESSPNMIKEVVCKGCGKECDYVNLPEVKMGAVRCPNCNEVMDQEGNVYGRGV